MEARVAAKQTFWQRLRVVLEMIKIEHTLFALPFAFIGALLAANGLPTARQLWWIVVAMVGARSAAMAFNRLVDRDYDARNPRTRMRAIPAGLLSVRFVLGFTAAASALLVLAAWQLNPLAFALSPLALLIVFFYSFTKRFTALAHVFLGVALAIAPIGAWIAVRGSFGAPALWLGGAVVFWLVGLDVIYALQDREFDEKAGLHSLPVALGAERALLLARISHALMIAALVQTGRAAGLGGWYFAGVLLAAALILFEHAIISPRDLRRLNVAFFQVNSVVSVGLLIFTALDVLL